MSLYIYTNGQFSKHTCAMWIEGNVLSTGQFKICFSGGSPGAIMIRDLKSA